MPFFVHPLPSPLRLLSRLRPAFQVLRKDFVLVHETGLEIDEAYVLVFTPFAVLCDLAEDREINFGIKHEEPPVAAMTKWQKFRKFFELEDRVTPEPSANFQRGRLPQVCPASASASASATSNSPLDADR